MAGSKAKAADVKIFRVMRSFDAFNEGELYGTNEDEWTRSRVNAGLLREVEDADVEKLLQRGQVVLAGGIPGTRRAGTLDGAAVDSSDEAGS